MKNANIRMTKLQLLETINQLNKKIESMEFTQEEIDGMNKEISDLSCKVDAYQTFYNELTQKIEQINVKYWKDGDIPKDIQEVLNTVLYMDIEDESKVNNELYHMPFII